ncbi:hypothetical protein EDB80DRAFT_700087 [Ilyonectria destructans]|nr:hypothetical protein EDB80DRAFT_700087 [Ilyonectria destructans]
MHLFTFGLFSLVPVLERLSRAGLDVEDLDSQPTSQVLSLTEPTMTGQFTASGTPNMCFDHSFFVYPVRKLGFCVRWGDSIAEP